MPWKTSEAKQRRWEFIVARLRGDQSMSALCREYGISRECGHKWWRRFRAEGRSGLVELSRRTDRARQLQRRWRERLLRARQRLPDWGPAKLRWWLGRKHPQEPSVRVLGAWLAAAGLTRRRPRRVRPGPVVPLLPPVRPVRPNDVWTIDFKGEFYTANRTRVTALTVRDLATRFVLATRHVRPCEPDVAAVVRRLFRQYGLPRALRSDNGPPFGSLGPRGWTTLSLGWIKLGLRVEYGRPACPQDNPGHEQMHRVLKAATARPPAPNLAAQQTCFDRWRRWYNHHRPHAALGQRPPAELYQPSPRSLPRQLPVLVPSAAGTDVRLDGRGRLYWCGRQRAVSKTFAHEIVRLCPRPAGIVAVHFGPYLIGTLHPKDPAGMRPVRWRSLPLPSP
jgi:putative transposase